MDARRIATQHRPELIAAALLLLMAVNLLSVIARKSITIDETLAIPSGYYYLTTRAFNLDSDHPPLPKLLAASPLVLLSLERPSLDDVGDERSTQQTLVAANRFWSANQTQFRSIFFWGRVPMIALTMLLGVLIFAFARRLFNQRAAVLAVTLFCLEPNILAHGRVVKDIHVALAYLLFFFALYVYKSAPTLRRALFLGAACGVSLGVKYSLVVLFPLLLVLVSF